MPESDAWSVRLRIGSSDFCFSCGYNSVAYSHSTGPVPEASSCGYTCRLFSSFSVAHARQDKKRDIKNKTEAKNQKTLFSWILKQEQPHLSLDAGTHAQKTRHTETVTSPLILVPRPHRVPWILHRLRPLTVQRLRPLTHVHRRGRPLTLVHRLLPLNPVHRLLALLCSASFSSRWHLCAWKSPYALHPVFEKFPPRCL